MSPKARELHEQVMTFPLKQRLEFVQFLLESCDDKLTEEEAAALWAPEIERQVDGGRMVYVSDHEMMRRLDALLRKLEVPVRANQTDVV